MTIWDLLAAYLDLHVLMPFTQACMPTSSNHSGSNHHHTKAPTNAHTTVSDAFCSS